MLCPHLELLAVLEGGLAHPQKQLGPARPEDAHTADRQQQQHVSGAVPVAAVPIPGFGAEGAAHRISAGMPAKPLCRTSGLMFSVLQQPPG